MNTNLLAGRPFWHGLICFAAEDGAGGGGGTAPAGGGNDTLAPGDDTAPGGGGNDTLAGGNGGDGAKWWEGDKLKDYKDMLVANGLTVDDPLDAVARLAKMETAAQQKLGKSADQLMDRPGDGQDVAAWLRENGETFGIPDAVDKYEIERPADWPEGAKWNDDLEKQAREIAFEEGLSGKALTRMAGLYSGAVAQLEANSKTDLANANAEMMTALQKDWGEQTNAKLTLAGQAASVIAEKAGLDQVAMANIAEVLKPKIGDAGTMRLFAQIGEMMGDDAFVAPSGNPGGMSTTPAEARSELARMQAPGGEYYEAVKRKDRTEVNRLEPTIDRLTKASI